MKKPNIDTAVIFLNAEQVSPRRWRYYDDATRSFWVVSSKDMEKLAGMLERGAVDAYSLWCTASDATESR